jgi:hypothetical protein
MNHSDWIDKLTEHYGYEDLRFPLTQSKFNPTTLRPDFDFTNVGYLFPQNNDEEIVYMIGQMPHSYVEGTDIKPHIHFQQSAATVPVFKLDYKWFDLGAAVPATFTTIATTELVFPYTSGNIHQMATFPDISGGGISKVSSVLLFKLYRDDNIVTGDVLAFEFDLHYRSHAIGSRYVEGD